MKYKKLKIRLRRTIKTYKKTRDRVDREIFIMYREIHEVNPNLSEIEKYKEIKMHVSAEEKDLNYAGARTIRMTFATAVLTFLTTTLIFDSRNQESILFKSNQFISEIKEALNFPSWLITSFILLALVLLPAGFAVGFFLEMITISDSKVRKEIYKFNIMNQVIDEKIKDLENR